MNSPRKRSRSDSLSPADDASNMPKCHLTRMPLELLAEILSYTSSTRDILALARTSKQFCTVLVNNVSTEFIWRQARARSLPQSLPDFSPNFTEASFAAFLFDPKVCEVCLKKTKEVYYSFALRAGVCDKPTCLSRWRSQNLYRISAPDEVAHPDFLQWIPRLEHRDVPAGASNVVVRRADWKKAIDEHTRVQLQGVAALEAYTKEKQALADVLPAKIELCRTLVRWRGMYTKKREKITETNRNMAVAFAKKHGWRVHNLLQTASFSILHNSKNRCLEEVTEEECEMLKASLKSELAEMEARVQRREREHALRQRHEHVQSKWGELKSTHSTEKPKLPPALPSYREFGKLSVIKIYKTTPPAGETRDLQDPFIASVLAENLQQWRETARAALAGVLGFPGWKSLSKRKLHPVDRLTARFRCPRCDVAANKDGKTAFEDGGMDFTQTCEHVCGHLQRKRQNKERWSAERFVPDRRAVDAILQVLSLCNASAEDVDSVRIVEEVGDRVQCQSCSCVMDMGSVARHCKRHVECSFILLPSGSSAEPPIEHGLEKQLMKKSTTNEADQKVYSCRHCVILNAPAVGNAGRARQNKLFTFNGLRSHVKEKHSINPIADEDFFRRQDDISNTSADKVEVVTI